LELVVPICEPRVAELVVPICEPGAGELADELDKGAAIPPLAGTRLVMAPAAARF
jgi:hypothetical protein